jgi:hypothetical protein
MGIQMYAGYEVDRPEMRQVRVYRPESEVFHRDSMRTFAGLPIVMDHSTGWVTPENWRDHAVGETSSDDIVRDGETVKVPFMVRDANAIAQIEAGKAEISMGYAAELDWTAGQTPGGEPYDAVQRTLRMNSLSVVDHARGGPALRIGDSEPEKKTMTTKTVLVDGLSVETTDAGETAIVKLLGERDAARADAAKAQTTIGEHVAAIAAKDGELVALKAQLADAQSPDKLAAAATARAKLCEDAKRIIPTLVTDGKADDVIRREVVDAKLGDAGKALEDGPAVAGAFSALAAAAPAKGTPARSDPVASAIVDGNATDVGDLRAARDKARQGRLDYLHGKRPINADRVEA